MPPASPEAHSCRMNTSRRFRPGPLVTVLGTVLVFGSVTAASALIRDDPEPAPAEAQVEAQGKATPGDRAPGSRSTESQAAGPWRVYYGHLDNGGASVAMVVGETVASAYVCYSDGVELWLDGSVPARGQVLMHGSNSGAELRAVDFVDQVLGHVRYDKRRVGFTAEPAAPARWVDDWNGRLTGLVRSDRFVDAALEAAR